MTNTDIDSHDIDLSDTPFDNPDDVTVIDSNGQKYLAGTDTHGWFSVTMVTLYPSEREDSEYEWRAKTVGEFPTHSFTGDGLDALIDAAP